MKIIALFFLIIIAFALNPILGIICLAIIAVIPAVKKICKAIKRRKEISKHKKQIVSVGNQSFFSLNPYEFEEYVAEYLKQLDYTNIDVTPKSGDYGADVIAVSPKKEKTAIQCKLYSSPIGVKAVQEVSSAKGYYHCQKRWLLALVAIQIKLKTWQKALM